MTLVHFVYSVYDRKAQYYLPPFVARSDADAIRSFIEAVKQPDVPMSLYPSDFDLVRCGTFDLDSGELASNGCFVLLNGFNALEVAHRERRQYAAAFAPPEPALEEVSGTSPPLS